MTKFETKTIRKELSSQNMMDSCETDAMAPLVSIIVITRNRSASLKRTLQALACLDYPSYEIIVVDNGSLDDTAQVINQFSAKYIFSPVNNGMSLSRQLGVEAACGEIIAMCDDDCVPIPEWLQHLVRRLSTGENFALVGGQVINIGFPASKQYKGRSKWTDNNGKIAFAADPKEADFFGNANFAFKKSIIQSIGGYDIFYKAGKEEIDLIMRLRRNGFVIDYEPEAIVRHFFTGANFKLGRFFYDNHLMRLYLYLKHCRPHDLAEWWRFSIRELRLLGDDLYKWARAFAAAVLRGNPYRLLSVAIELFNIMSARLAIPWLLRRARLRCLEESTKKLQLLDLGNDILMPNTTYS